MPYNRKMPDWSIKVYHTEDEFYELFDKKILESAEELIRKIRLEKIQNQKIIVKEEVYA